MKTMLAVIAVAGLMAGPAAAQANVTGKWEMTSETPRGMVTQIIIFQQDGNAISGTLERQGGAGGARAGGGGGGGGRAGGAGAGGPAEIESGSLEGTTITFVVVRGFGDRVFETEYAGTVDGDTITGTATSQRGETEFTMKRVAT